MEIKSSIKKCLPQKISAYIQYWWSMGCRHFMCAPNSYRCLLFGHWDLFQSHVQVVSGIVPNHCELNLWDKSQSFVIFDLGSIPEQTKQRYKDKSQIYQRIDSGINSNWTKNETLGQVSNIIFKVIIFNNHMCICICYDFYAILKKYSILNIPINWKNRIFFKGFP